MRIHPKVKSALENCGKPYEVVTGKKHLKLVVGGKLAAIIPSDGMGNDANPRAVLNVVCQIKRATR